MDTSRRRGSGRTNRRIAAAGMAVIGIAAVGAVVPAHAAEAAPASARPKAPSFGVSLQPIDVAVATYAHRAYVATPQYVDVVDTTTRERVTMIETGLDDQTAITLVQAGAKVYVGSFDDKELAVLDPETNTITGTITVGTGTTAIADVVTPRGEFAYVTQYGKHTSRVTVVDASTDTVVGRIHVGGDPVAATQTPDLKRVWVGTEAGENVKVINPATRKVVQTIAMKRSGPVGGISFAPRGHQAYVTGLGGLTVVKVATGAPSTYLPAPYLFRRDASINTGPVATGPHGTLYVMNSTFPDSPGTGSVTVLDRGSLKVVSNTRLGQEPTSMAMDPQGRQAFFTNYAGASMSYLSTKR